VRTQSFKACVLAQSVGMRKLLEDEARGAIDIAKFYQQPGAMKPARHCRMCRRRMIC